MLGISHVGKQKIKVNFELQIRAASHLPKELSGKYVSIGWRRGAKHNGETARKLWDGESKLNFEETFTLRSSFFLDQKSQKFEPKKLAFALNEGNDPEKKKTILKQTINIAEYGRDGFNEIRLVCFGKNAAKDPCVEVRFKASWEKFNSKKITKVTEEAEKTAKTVNIAGADYNVETVSEISEREESTNLDFSNEDENSEKSERSGEGGLSESAGGSNKADAPSRDRAKTDGPALKRKSNSHRRMTSGGSGSKPVITVNDPERVKSDKNLKDSLTSAITGKDKVKAYFSVVFHSIENLSPASQGHRVYVKWKRASKEGQYGQSKKHDCSGSSVPIEETAKVECTLMKEKKTEKFAKKLIAFQIREISAGDHDKELVKFELDLASFAEDGNSFTYTAKKSDKFPYLAMEISCTYKHSTRTSTGSLSDKRSSSLNLSSEHDAQTDLSMDEEFEEVALQSEKSVAPEPKREKSRGSLDEEEFTSYNGKQMIEYNPNFCKKNPDYAFKVIMIGDSGVGKTNILNRYNGGKFDRSSISTIGVNLFSKVYVRNSDNKVISLGVWDTAGQERFKSITKSYFRGANGVVLVYDMTDKRTFDHLVNWANEVRESNPNQVMTWVLIGNKADLGRSQVSQTVALEFAKELNGGFMETSALTNYNIHEAFESLVIALSESVVRNQLSTGTQESLPKTDVVISPQSPNPTSEKQQQTSCC
eukprot:TRINITY_DN2710_c0_g1_i1.p1 TRINITY_DN2710_c0_g1~~TRINITY_DN2710_c0_g1_i1.p1  ORF type:complete len:707 (+),score=181.74 TRINITY_DN2710_c0_g1_i1:63-2183(+)